jgi:hypothetical protein
VAYRRAKVCGREHPTRKGIKCWGKGCDLDDQHWAYMQVSKVMQKITWRLYEEPKSDES